MYQDNTVQIIGFGLGARPYLVDGTVSLQGIPHFRLMHRATEPWLDDEHLSLPILS